MKSPVDLQISKKKKTEKRNKNLKILLKLQKINFDKILVLKITKSFETKFIQKQGKSIY